MKIQKNLKMFMLKLNVLKNEFVINIISKDILEDVAVIEILKQFNNNFTKKLRISLIRIM